MDYKDELRKIVIEGGKIRMIYSDEIASKLNRDSFTVERASHVDYNNEKKVWEIRGIDGTLFGCASTREEALKKEVQMLQEIGIIPLKAQKGE